MALTKVNANGIVKNLPGAYHLYVLYPNSSTNYWSKTGATYGDFTVTGTIPTPTTIKNSNFGTISKATSNLPGINFSAPRTGTIKCTAVMALLPGQNASVTQYSYKMLESTTVVDIAFASGSIGENTTNNIQFPVTMTGYFDATAGVTYNFKLQGSISQGTAYVGASNGEQAVGFVFEYIT